MLIKITGTLLIFIISPISSAASSTNTAKYIGSNACINCHQLQYSAWQGSHHDLAMQHADESTVLGDFNNKKFTYNGVTSTFFTKGKQFFVNTDGSDGNLKDYRIKYTFGIEPLQQYLIEFASGRMQALGIAWDNRPAEKGGQRWYHLYPGTAVDHTDPLHWTKADQNWNYMCADCHSTNLQKNYDAEKDSYQTNWSEIDVACEACHGPASKHLDWALKKSGWKQLDKQNKGLLAELDERRGINWKMDATSGNSSRSKAKTTNHEIDICARCHSRRSVINDNYAHDVPLMDSYQPALLTDFLYHPDGQIKEEVYVYGSFVQSKMYQKGVTCNDCHEPHSLKLRATGKGVCLQCHAESKFNQDSHHFHSEKGTGSSCVECHMPQTSYMRIDGRHDHSIRIPRPDLSIKINTPNACNQCHKDKNPLWAQQNMLNWYGKDWDHGWHFGETLNDARNHAPGAGVDVATVAASPELSSITRATATEMLQNFPSPTSFLVIKKSLADKNELIRLSALRTLDNIDVQYRQQLATPLLSDPIRAIRIEAARILAAVPRYMFTRQQQLILDEAISEYIQAQLVNAERPESHLNIGLIRLSLQQYEEAEDAYQQAIKLAPEFIATYVNLADLYRLQQKDEKAEKILTQALQISPEAADTHHALGLLYVRKKQMHKALLSLSRAAKLQQENIRYSYVYAIALNSDGQTSKAITLLKQILQSQPQDVDSHIALISFYKRQGDISSATQQARKLLEIQPELGAVEKILESL